MNEIKLIVLGQELEVEGNFGFGLNYNIDDVKDPSKRNGNYSKSITLAGTKKANKLLGNLYDINSDFTFFNPNVRSPAKIVVNSTTVMSGYMRLISVDKSFHSSTSGNNIVYKVNIQADTTDFFSEIKDKKLEELDFSDFNHALTGGNVVDSWSHTFSDAYVYPLLQHTSNAYTPNNFAPAIFHKAYLKRIAIEAGYSISGDLMDETTEEGLQYSKDIIPFNGGSIALTPTQIEQKRFRAEQQTTKNIYTGLTTTATFNGNFDFINNDSTNGNFNNGDYLPASSAYRSDGASNCNFFLNTQLEVKSQSTIFTDMENVRWEFKIFRLIDGGNSTEVFSQNGGMNNLTSSNGFLDIQIRNPSITLSNLTLQNGEELKFTYQFSLVDIFGSIQPTVAAQTIDINATVFSNEVNGSSIQEGYNLILSNAIPKDIKQTDLITDLIKRYNAYLYVNPDNDKDIIIDTRDGFYLDGETLDWTNKKDYSKKDSIKLLGELQSKELEFTYTEDNDNINEVYKNSVGEVFGSKKVEFVNDFVKGTNKIQTPFAPTPLVGNSTFYAAIVPAISSNTESKIRVLHYGGLKPCVTTRSWSLTFINNFSTNATTVSTFNTYPYCGHLNDPYNPTLDLNFGENQFSFYEEIETFTQSNSYNRYWRNYIEQINKGKLLTAYFNLNEVDIHKVKNNLNSKIFIKDSYYYINKIVDYNPVTKNVTKVELLKINDGIKFIDTNIKQPFQPTNSEIYKIINNTNEDNYTESYNSNFTGNNNSVGFNSPNAVVIGDNNIVGNNVENAFIVGSSNRGVFESGTGYIGGAKYVNGLPEELVKPYKSYTALLNQTGTNAPTITVLNSELPFALASGYTSSGSYVLTSSNTFTTNKTFVMLNATTDEKVFHDIPNTSNINIYTRDKSNVATDGILNNCPIEIRVYD